MAVHFFDPNILGDSADALDFITRFLHALTDHSIIGIDHRGTILLWNEGARRMYGYEPGEILGNKNISVLHSKDDIEIGIPRKILGTVLDKLKWEGTLKHQRKNGEPITVKATITLRHDSTGSSTGFLIITNEITKLQQDMVMLRKQINTLSLSEKKYVKTTNFIKLSAIHPLMQYFLLMTTERSCLPIMRLKEYSDTKNTKFWKKM